MSAKSQVRTQSPPTVWEEETDSNMLGVLSYGLLISRKKDLISYCLTKKVFSFGRDPKCDCSTKLDFVSEKHFEISRGDSEEFCYIRDLSTWGTFINKEKITKGILRKLSDGDTISVGNCNIQIFDFFHNQDNDLPPELKRKYVLAEVLGSGGFGTVRKVFDKITCRPYAMKIVYCNKSMVLKNEMNIFQSIKHPFIVNFQESFLNDEALYIVMEHMNDGNLELLLRDDLNECHVKYIFYQVAIAVEYLHDKHIIHRDIKPENILVKKHSNYEVDVSIKISDFGLSKLLDEYSKTNTVCGTNDYIAPEVLDRQPYNYTADIWSMGKLLLYMFNKMSLSTMNMPNDLDVRAPTNISAHAIALIRAMLIRQPSTRIKINEIMEHPWIQEDELVQQKLKAVFEEERGKLSNVFEVIRFPFLS